MTNTRSSSRYTLGLQVEIETEQGAEATVTRNESLGGLFIVTSQRPAVGTRVKLRLSLPGQKDPIAVAAIVRWSDDHGIGVQFDGLRAKDVWALGRYFESH
jgi:uncharacterized protein (TIGR02266 family)